MKIKKSSLLYRFVFYAQAEDMRPDKDDAVTFALRFIAECILVPLFTFIILTFGLLFGERAKYFWEGSLYQNIRIKIPFSQRMKRIVLSVILQAVFYSALFYLVFPWFVDNIEPLLAQLGYWIFKNILLLCALVGLANIILFFRNRLPKVEYINNGE